MEKVENDEKLMGIEELNHDQGLASHETTVFYSLKLA